MKLVARSFAWLLPLLLSACVHNANQSQMQPLAPPIDDTPPPPPDSAPANLPPPVYSLPKTTEPVVVQETPKPAPKHHKAPAKPTTTAQTDPTLNATAPQVAIESAPPEESAIGKFGTPEAPDKKKQAEDSISEVEKGLNGIARKLNDQEEKTASQIKEFLKAAKIDLNSGDLDAAKTLTEKAKALLGELTQ